MSYLLPMGDIQLFRNVPLDPSYRHTVKWESKAVRDNYFTRWVNTHVNGADPEVLVFTKQNYTRATGQVIRLSRKAEDILPYNYLRFRNTKSQAGPVTYNMYDWFYAFVTNVSYVNENCCEIGFMIDAVTTFFPDCTLLNSFVEREHTATDYLGEHLVPENIEYGEYTQERPIMIDYFPKEPGTVPVYFRKDGVIQKTAQGRPRYQNTLETAMPFDFQNWYYVVAATFAFSETTQGTVYKGAPPQLYDNEKNPAVFSLYNGLFFTVLSSSASVNTFLQNAVSVTEGDESQGIVGIFMFPRDFQPYGRTNASAGQLGPVISKCVQSNTTWGLSGNYASNPLKNNKMYSYPYTYFVLSAHDGKSVNLKQENFTRWTNPDTGYDETAPYFFLTCSLILSASPQAIAYPGLSSYLLPSGNQSACGVGEGYEGVAMNTNYKVDISSFPMCSYKTDAYMSWLAQNQGRLEIERASLDANYIIGGVSNAVRTGLGLAGIATGGLNALQGNQIPGQTMLPGMGPNLMPGFAGAAVNMAGTVVNSVSSLAGSTADYWFANRKLDEEMRVASMRPPVAHSTSSPNADMLQRTFGFRLYCVHLREDAARAVDNYFTMYGYRCEQIKIPNTDVRPLFTYTKTKNCNIKGKVPHEYLRLISDCFDAGITFWKHSNENESFDADHGILGWVGLYDADNHVQGSAVLQGDNDTLTAQAFTKNEILSDFTQYTEKGVSWYAKNSDSAPHTVNPETLTLTTGKQGDVKKAYSTLDTETGDPLWNYNDEDFFVSLLPCGQITNLLPDGVTFSVSEELVNLLPDNGSLTFSYYSNA